MLLWSFDGVSMLNGCNISVEVHAYYGKHNVCTLTNRIKAGLDQLFKICYFSRYENNFFWIGFVLLFLIIILKINDIFEMFLKRKKQKSKILSKAGFILLVSEKNVMLSIVSGKCLSTFPGCLSEVLNTFESLNVQLRDKEHNRTWKTKSCN